ncbi:hypothetical protein H0H87_010490, partial [Tephrocybe sp. NHM501043]
MGVIVDDMVRGQKGVAERGAETHRTCSSDAKEGGFEFQSNRMSGCMTCTRARPSDAEESPHQAIHHPALEQLEHNCPVARHKLCLAAPTQYHPFPDVQDRHDRYDVPELTRAGALDVRVELRLEESELPRPK